MKEAAKTQNGAMSATLLAPTRRQLLAATAAVGVINLGAAADFLSGAQGGVQTAALSWRTRTVSSRRPRPLLSNC